jgi:hypothetical protein
MPETTRQFGNLTIHFLGDNAQQLASTFDSAYDRSPSFQGEIASAARQFRDFNVGSSLDDLARAPGYEGLDWSGVPADASAFGQLGGPDSYFSVVTGADHDLVQDGRRFAGTTELSIVHELLHPMQTMRDLAQGRYDNPNRETQVQMREQGIAKELGYKPGETFPDVVGTGTGYQVVAPQRDPDTQPNNRNEFGPLQPNAAEHDGPFGWLQPNAADETGAFPASPPQTEMRPQQVPAQSASPIDVPVPPALQPLVPFFFPAGPQHPEYPGMAVDRGR